MDSSRNRRDVKEGGRGDARRKCGEIFYGDEKIGAKVERSSRSILLFLFFFFSPSFESFLFKLRLSAAIEFMQSRLAARPGSFAPRKSCAEAV